MAGPDNALASSSPHRHRYRHRRKKKFWRRPSWWSNIGKTIIMMMLGTAAIFLMWLVWAGFLGRTQ